jgi:hypothetical protein
MSIPDHECEPEEVCAGLVVALHLDLIRPLCPQHDEKTLRKLMERHAEPIAAHMMSAGLAAAAKLFNGDGGSS